MTLIKVYCYFVAFLKKIIYKIIYGKRLKFGKRTTFRKSFNITILGEGYIEIGNNCFFNNGCSLNCLGHIKIGIGSIFGEDVKIYDHNHRFVDISRPIKKQGYSIGEVVIGKHCWIGSNVILLKGTVIGDNCIIGAGCLIKGNIPSNTIVKANSKLSFENISIRM